MVQVMDDLTDPAAPVDPPRPGRRAFLGLAGGLAVVGAGAVASGDWTTPPDHAPTPRPRRPPPPARHALRVTTDTRPPLPIPDALPDPDAPEPDVVLGTIAIPRIGLDTHLQQGIALGRDRPGARALARHGDARRARQRRRRRPPGHLHPSVPRPRPAAAGRPGRVRHRREDLDLPDPGDGDRARRRGRHRRPVLRPHRHAVRLPPAGPGHAADRGQAPAGRRDRPTRRPRRAPCRRSATGSQAAATC